MNIHQTATEIPVPLIDQNAQQLLRILEKLDHDKTVLALAKGLEVAVVVRESEQGAMDKIATVGRNDVMALIMKDWIISDDPQGRIVRYHISQSGRAELRQQLENDALLTQEQGSDRPSDLFPDQCTPPKPNLRAKYGSAESPLLAMARRKTKTGANFLEKDLVMAGEQLREDYEVALIKHNTPIDWLAVISSGVDAEISSDCSTARVTNALSVLGPGLGEVAYYCCCKLMGLEMVEQKMGWSARSGKIVMRIALQRLKRHYEDHGQRNDMIG